MHSPDGVQLKRETTDTFSLAQRGRSVGRSEKRAQVSKHDNVPDGNSLELPVRLTGAHLLA